MRYNHLVELEIDLGVVPEWGSRPKSAASRNAQETLQHTGTQALRTTLGLSDGPMQHGPMVRFLCSCPNFHFRENSSTADRQFAGAAICLMTSHPDL